jgi:hypothetical protein
MPAAHHGMMLNAPNEIAMPKNKELHKHWNGSKQIHFFDVLRWHPGLYSTAQ